MVFRTGVTRVKGKKRNMIGYVGVSSVSQSIRILVQRRMGPIILNVPNIP